ncbi:aromatic ring-hydroxylating oxygenase subunit alpha [Ornithinimicrobium sufpigmenti]|uniref:aromatic ring-hydroxylating oxygenase subunit alpha n=1 Tax=Ornithinimicrobium sufpigmenti TaxID=2508882 RepID=UPI001035B400|nr:MULTISPECIES: Rieske 2Fe-2S domain-containing protein [unclassified Ornithinimicrobium]
MPDSVNIPRSYYRDEDALHQEYNKIFGQNWLFVGHETEIPAAGDYVTRRMGANPVIMSRTEDGDVHVMLNSCTHRGTELCKLSYGNTTTFRCGYHGWVFSPDGQLRGVPGPCASGWGETPALLTFALHGARSDQY